MGTIKILEKKIKDLEVKLHECQLEVKDLEVKLHKCQVEAEKQRLKHVDIDDKGKAQKD